MTQELTLEVHRLVQVAINMAQELQEFVDEAKEAVEGDENENPLQSTQDLVNDWERAYAEANVAVRWQDEIFNTDGGSELNI